ncbi:MAG: hypothetical protein H7249_00335 [Chitinophagaceae bacterium]|nr:hypothetical protein [Oligoflexus sp.]
MKFTTAPFRAPYIKGSNEGIPRDRYETDYIEFEDGDYRLSDLKQMGWNLEVFRGANDIYLFYEATNQPKTIEGGGLKFLALENISGESEGDSNGVDLKVFAYGYGYADGIRHIYYGSGHQKGYFYYPPLATMAALLLKVEELAHIHCRDVETFSEVHNAEENYVNH